ncbi:MAG: SRPBCC family protein [Candidatus Limnocylindrales bacterium]
METTMTATRIDRGSNETTTIYSEGTELVFERTFDAPRDLVWKAFTDRELIPKWWGPHGTTTTVVEMDVRQGGKWRYISSAPDRDDVAFYGEYLEVTPPDSYRWTFMFDVEGVGPMGGPESHHFEDLGGKTRVVSIGYFDSVESIDGALSTGMGKGAIETWDRLAALLEAA